MAFFGERWKQIEIYDEFTLLLPAKAIGTVAEDGRALVLRLPTKPATEILVSRHPFPGEWEPLPFMLSTVRSFFREVVPGVSDAALETSVVRLPRGTYGRDIVQGVASHESNDMHWLVRACAVGKDFLWLQWNGPKKFIGDPALRVFESLRLGRDSTTPNP